MMSYYWPPVTAVKVRLRRHTSLGLMSISFTLISSLFVTPLICFSHPMQSVWCVWTKRSSWSWKTSAVVESCEAVIHKEIKHKVIQTIRIQDRAFFFRTCSGRELCKQTPMIPLSDNTRYTWHQAELLHHHRLTCFNDSCDQNLEPGLSYNAVFSFKSD